MHGRKSRLCGPSRDLTIQSAPAPLFLVDVLKKIFMNTFNKGSKFLFSFPYTSILKQDANCEYRARTMPPKKSKIVAKPKANAEKVNHQHQDSESDEAENSQTEKIKEKQKKKKKPKLLAMDMAVVEKEYTPKVLQELKNKALKDKSDNSANSFGQIMVVEREFRLDTQLVAGYAGFHTTTELKEFVDRKGKFFWDP
jgi:hypothetical protein